MSPEDDSAPSLYGNSQSGADSEPSNAEPEDAPESEFSDADESDVDPEAAERHLTELLNDRELHDLMQSGEYEAFRQRLKKRQSRTEDPDRLAAIEYALANPHEFAEPVESAPTLWTLNGIGTKVYGEDQFDSLTGLYLKTLYFTFFWIPIFPIRRYLVRSMGDEYQFFAKVDLGNFHHWWRRIIVMGVIAAAGLTAYGIATHQPDVRFVNGFDRAVEVSVGDKTTVEVPARSVKVEDLPSGEHQFTAWFASDETRAIPGGDRLIEKRSFSIPQFKDLIAYNIAGMAPAYIRSVTYFSATAASRNDQKQKMPTITPIAGQSRYISDDVDYFNAVEPPEEIEMSAGSDKEVRWRFRYDGEGPETSAAMLTRHAPDRLDSFLKKAIEFYPQASWVYSNLGGHLDRLAEDDPDRLPDWFDLLEEQAVEHPDVMSLHSFYATEARRFAEHLDRPPPIETYRERHKAQNSAESALMLAHIVDSREEASTLLNFVLDQADTDTDSELVEEAHAQLGALKSDQNCKSAVKHFRKSGRSADTFTGHYLESYAVCLAVTGNIDQSLNLLRTNGADGMSTALRHAVTYGRVVLSVNSPDYGKDPFGLFNDVVESNSQRKESPELRVAIGNEIGYAFSDTQFEELRVGESGRLAAELNRTLFRTPETFPEFVAENPKHFIKVDTSIQALALLSTHARGDSETVQSLSNITGKHSNIVAWLDQESPATSLDEPPPEHWQREEKAAYLISRAAFTENPENPQKTLKKAKEILRLHGPLTVVANYFMQPD